MRRVLSFLLVAYLIPVIARSQTAPAIAWQRCLGSSWNEVFYDAARTHDGGYIAVGATTMTEEADVSGGHGYPLTNIAKLDLWVVRLDSAGEIKWQRCMGGRRDDVGIQVLSLDDGGFLVGGMTESSDGDITHDHGGLHGAYDRYSDIWLIRLDSTGRTIWQQTYGGEGIDWLDKLIKTSDGGFAFIGATTSAGGDITGFHPDDAPNDAPFGADVWVVKLDSSGRIDWQSVYGGTRQEMQTSIAETSDHGFLFSAYSLSSDGDLADTVLHGKTWVAKISSLGIIQWQHRYGGISNNSPTEIITTSNGGYILLGTRTISSEALPCYGSGDLWLLKLDSVGHQLWERDYGGSGFEYPGHVVEQRNGSYLIVGSTTSNDYDIHGLHGAGQDLLLLETDSGGNMQWSHTYGGTGTEGSFYPLGQSYYYGLTTQFGVVLEPSGDITVATGTNSDDGDVEGKHNHGDDDEKQAPTTSDAWFIHLSAH